MDGFEHIVLGLIKDFKKVDLEFAIERGLSLAKLVVTHEPYLITLARLAYPFYRNQAQFINYNTVMSWLRQVRPDLYEVIMASKKGQYWLKKQIKEIKNLILGGAMV